MKIAIFTMQNDENYYLPIWCKHYNKSFKPEDIYVLDHCLKETKDNIAINMEKNNLCNRIPIISEIAFPEHRQQIETNKLRKHLLEDKGYDAVFNSDTDEFIIPKDFDTLKEWAEANKNPENFAIRAKGYNIMQNLNEKLKQETPILENFEWCKEDNWINKWIYFTKPLITCNGFHALVKEIDNYRQEEIGNYVSEKDNVNESLAIIHLKFANTNIIKIRQNRFKGKSYGSGLETMKRDDATPYFNLPIDEETIEQWKKEGPLESWMKIPEWIKSKF